MILALTFCVSIISSNALLTMAFFFLLSVNFSLGMALILWYLVGLLLAYLVPKFPKILHSSEECTGPWMRRVLYLTVGISTCRFLRLQALSHFSWQVHEEVASSIFFLMSKYHVDDSVKGRYDIIIGQYILTELGLNLILYEHVIEKI